ncbi:hypothetical protein U9M48_004052, partial [Paspalum notatum var. saurae]
ERYRLDGEGDYEKEKMAKRVFNKAATKVVRDSFSNARIQAIVNFHKRVKNLNVKKTPDLKKMHLEAEEYVQGEIDWIMKDPEAWRWICNHWAGSDFQGASDRNRGNRTSKPGMQRFRTDGFIGKEQRMVYIEGHKGSDPDNPEVLCDEQATEKLAKYKENVIQRHGPEFDWRAAAPDVEAIYEAGGGLRHGRWGLGDGALEYDRIPRPQRTSQGSSSRRPSRAQQEAQQEETRRFQEETRKLRENNDYMMTYLMTLSQKVGGDVPEFRPPQPYQQVPPNYFVSSPMTQGPPLGDAPEFRPPPNYYSTPTSQGSPRGDAQGSQPPNQIIPSGQASQPQQWMYPTQGPPFGDASQSQPPQWMYHPMMMYHGQQPMFYLGSQPPYYMPWRPTGAPMTPQI